MRALAIRAVVTAVTALVALTLPWASSPASADGGPVYFPGDPNPVVIPDNLNGTLVDVAPDGSSQLVKNGQNSTVGGALGKSGNAANGIMFALAGPGYFQAASQMTCLGLHGVVMLFGVNRTCPGGGWSWLTGVTSDGAQPAGTTYNAGTGTLSVLPWSGLTSTQALGVLISCRDASGNIVTKWGALTRIAGDFAPTGQTSGACDGISTGSPVTTAGTYYGYYWPGSNGAPICTPGCSLLAVRVVGYPVSSGSPTGSKWTSDNGYWRNPTQTAMTATTTITCQKGTDTRTVSQTVNWTSGPGVRSPEGSLSVCESALAGSHVSQITSTGGAVGLPAEVTTTVNPWTSAAATTYPLCTTNAPQGGCWLDLQRGGKSCFGPNVYCAGWLANETRWNMSCEWGPYSMALSVCEAQYGTRFDSETQAEPSPAPSPTPAPGTGGFPSTGTNPENGAPNVDPETGEPIPFDPNEDPEGTSCWGSGWSWNPLSWVYIPGKCLLTWAYVPPEGSIQEQIDLLKTQAETRAPFSVLTALGTAAGAVATGYSGAGGCGLLADFTTSDIDAPITCSQIRAVPGYGGLYALVSAGIYAATALALYRLFATYFETNSG